ncbi:MAG: SOS response-associated peptidase [Rhodospirillales bacterium]|nr:SOS response-associated peptidase [Rhodospirillales bacterium]MDH3791274.1 SOS response-associated peptidase [Rhodospirillales bacterium]MDH3913145.1 SOS response-associated peptidase [Rhodospirillales bacterium]MDH3919951.1 SOS response-associated peptidase [Rhodospirillales bacterium]MDH3966246.1 SOS response-associated peptidase [Rhodospirillales bacterium]
MCGRYSLTTPAEALRRVFGFLEQPNLAPAYNIAPTQAVAVLRLGADGMRHFARLRWGLVPAWAKDLSIGARMINARAESVADKPAFRSAFRQRRCLVMADGFYEWQKCPEGPKQPYRIALADGGPFGFAGLWESWTDKGSGETVETCTIVTTEANELLTPIHHRMPVILAPEDVAAWLDAAASPEAAQALLRPCPAAVLVAYPVSTRVNKVANDDPGVIAPLEEQEPEDAAAAQGRLL